MFSYYGSKSKIVDCYPPPKYEKIIEPFAGSARYSLKYFDRDVLLIDKYDVVVKIWVWLQQCSKNDIIGLPKLTIGLDIRNLNISEEEKLFLGMVIAGGSIQPRYKVSPFGDYEHGNQNVYKNIAKNLYKIKHWQIKEGSYSEIENIEATWFIDPPYQFGGEHYKESSKNINFSELAEWCKTRNGQVIVCENNKANWLPFKPIKKLQGVSNTNTVEAIWSNIPTNYDNVQQSLF